MDSLKIVVNVLRYPAIFGLVFGTFIIIYCVVMYIKNTWHESSKDENIFIIILLSCFLVGLVFLPLNHIVKLDELSKTPSGTGVGIYDEIAEYATKVYDTDTSEALTLLLDELKDDSTSFSDYDKGYDEGYQDALSNDSAYYDMGYDDGYAEGYFYGYDDAKAGKPNELDEVSSQ